MSFKLGDFKKTIRGRGEGRRIYPHQIRDDRHRAALGFALDYYERMVGRRQAEFDQAALLEFFGDPKLARGLVACLGSSYVWLSPALTDLVGSDTAAAFRRAGISRPADLRARLYQLLNRRFGGFIPPAERIAVLRELLAELETPALQPDQLEQALYLDADEQRVLHHRAPPPTPDAWIARYNYHSLETALCYAEHVTLHLHGTVWPMLRSAHNLSRRYRIGYVVGALPDSLFDNRLELHILGRKDALGGWGRTGRRLARVVLRMLAAHPGAAVSGEALVHLDGKPATLQLDQRALAILGAEATTFLATDTWEDTVIDNLQRFWSRAQSRGRTAGWGMRRDPEPLVGADALVVPDFVLQRGALGIALCIVPGRAAAGALAANLKRIGPGIPVIVLAPANAAPLLRGAPATTISYGSEPADAIGMIIAALSRNAPPQPAARSA
ncbi:MAG: DUF790 family protein [Oscillochloris sp.]|nr:DUF790 family protein [Oscillochloris sp.]